MLLPKSSFKLLSRLCFWRRSRQSSSPPSSVHTHGIVTTIPGRYIHPAKLYTMLRIRFGLNGYSVEMRHDTYYVTANSKVSWDDVKRCY
ncbi:hypothetical protein GGR57DRAFT_455609 [Xylariaceae sp. FL1272]|nr:hypothetical protein GGR57DRAFT_455609 [Xylariaceae sp. FL1272]